MGTKTMFFTFLSKVSKFWKQFVESLVLQDQEELEFHAPDLRSTIPVTYLTEV